MELLDRYLKAVGTYLPKAQRADIIQELSDNIRSQMEDREAQLGRPLSEAEQEEILTRVGNPLVVAGRYQKDQRTLTFGRQLIGPALFPLYLRVLIINLVVTSIITLGVTVILGYLDKPVTLPAIAFQLLLQFSIITAIFTVAETSITRNANKWNPRQPSAPQGEGSRFASLVELVVTLAFFFWWITVPNHVPGVLSAIGIPLQIGPGMYMLYAPIMLLSLAGIALAAFKLVRKNRTTATSFARPALTGMFLAVLCISLVAGHWLLLGEAAGQSPQVIALVEKINQWIRISLLIGVAVSALELFFEIRRTLKRVQTPVSPVANSLLTNSL